MIVNFPTIITQNAFDKKILEKSECIHYSKLIIIKF